MDSPWCVGQDSDHHGEGGTVSCDFEERGARLCPQPHPVCHHQWMLEHAKGNAVGFSSGLFSVEGNLKWNWSEVRCKLALKFANISCAGSSITIYAVKVLSGFRFELFTARPSWFSLWTKTSSGRWGGVHHLYGLFFRGHRLFMWDLAALLDESLWIICRRPDSFSWWKPGDYLHETWQLCLMKACRLFDESLEIIWWKPVDYSHGTWQICLMKACRLFDESLWIIHMGPDRYAWWKPVDYLMKACRSFT